MNMKKLIFLMAFLSFSSLFSQSDETEIQIMGSAFLENRSYHVLERICDEAGNRLAGTRGNEIALKLLQHELSEDGIEVIFEEFEMPGWYRGADEVKIVKPTDRTLRAEALGYVHKAVPNVASVVYAGEGNDEELKEIELEGKIALFSGAKSSRGISIKKAAEKGAVAALFQNNKEGGLLLAGVANFEGIPAEIPAFTITYEEGEWLRRLLKRNVPTEIRYVVNSYVSDEPIISKNAIVTFPGKVKEKIVLIAHFDAWDLGNGGIDNGLGTGILIDVARLINKYVKDNYYTIELVWCNGEELGLWGSKAYAAKHHEDVVAAINLDMTGKPVGFNTMGFDQYKEFFENLQKDIEGIDLYQGVVSQPWTNSDHFWFMAKGIPVFLIHGKLDKEMVHYYHDFADTFDKVSKDYLSSAAGVTAITLYRLANKDIEFERLTERQTIDFLRSHNLEEQLKLQHWWEFSDN